MAKQAYLSEEMTPPRIPEVERLAGIWVGLKEQRDKISLEEHQVRDQIINLLRANGLKLYEQNGLIITVHTGVETIKVEYEKSAKEKVKDKPEPAAVKPPKTKTAKEEEW